VFVYSVSDVAREAGRPIATVWTWTQKDILPAPNVRVGNRQYYSAEDYAEVAALLREDEAVSTVNTN
jgi:DNA-binding transcriptional MerR regulator